MSAGTAFSTNHAKISQTGDTMFSGLLTPEQSQDYFALAEKTSIVQQIAQKIPMGPTGVKIPHWTGNVAASWIGEGDMKPITKGDLSSQTIAPSKIATAIALAFDNAVINGTNTPFGAYIAQTSKTTSLADPLGAGKGVADGSNAYQALNGGLSLLLNAGKLWNGTLFDNIAEPILNGAVDTAQRPLFLDATYQDINAPFRSGRVLGRPTYLSDHVANGTTVGYMGDFSQVVWGQVGGLSFDVTDQATINLGTVGSPNFVSLWQHNLVAVRVEAEYGALVNDPQAFVKLTNVVTA